MGAPMLEHTRTQAARVAHSLIEDAAATGSCIETRAPGTTSHPRPESATESKAGAAPGSDDAIIFRRASVSLVAYIVPTHTHTPCAGAPTLLGDAVVTQTDWRL